MTYRGRVKNGVIVLDEAGALPEGAEVDVSPTSAQPAVDVSDESSEPTWAEVFKDLIGKAAGLPPDSSINHDHYLYGAPKK